MFEIDVFSLKQYLLEDESRIIDILEDLGFHHIKTHKDYISCGRPLGDNTSSTIIKLNEHISTKGYTQQSLTGDILTLTMETLNTDFVGAMKYIHKHLGLKYEWKGHRKKKDEIYSPASLFNKFKGRKKFDYDEVEIYGEETLDMFVPNLHESWLREGIVSFTAREFGIGYDFKRKRIIIPHRLWSGEKESYIGIIGRTVIPDYELLDIPKYYPIIKYSKGMNLYGLQENYKYIQQAGYVTVHEAEKSVLKRHSRLDKTGVAIMCKDITPEQKSILIGLNVDIVISLDKGIDINHIRSLCDMFYGIRNVYYIYDKYDLVPDKEAPADCDNKIYNYLFKYKIKYDEKERREYLTWLENQNQN